MERWLARWLAWAGVSTFRDLRGRAILPGVFAALPGDYADMRRRSENLGRHRTVDVPAFHGFQAIAAEERPGRRPRLGLRS
ncbi:MAG TPA: hypothetical protein VLH10_13235 [Yinghuangia sp.]|nr:hypothetical protein [Yinghuangia sp.]